MCLPAFRKPTVSVVFPGVHTTLKSDDPETQRAWIITPVQGDFIQLPEIAEEREMIAKSPTSCYNSSLGRSAQCGGLSRGLVAGPCMSSRSTDFELVVGVVATRDDAIKRYLVQVFSPAGVGSAEIALDPTDPSFANPVSAASGEGPNLDGRKAAGELLFNDYFWTKRSRNSGTSPSASFGPVDSTYYASVSGSRTLYCRTCRGNYSHGRQLPSHTPGHHREPVPAGSRARLLGARRESPSSSRRVPTVQRELAEDP